VNAQILKEVEAAKKDLRSSHFAFGRVDPVGKSSSAL
jgi:hypothetical protein